MKLKSKIEAILFLSDKPIKAAAISRIVSEDVQVVRQALLELIHDYEERDGGLEIADDDGYIIQVRDAYASIVDEFAPMEMPVALVRTLSAIAIKQPVAQSEVIKIRGAGAYDHIKDLILRDLITKREEGGRSPMLGTTKKFQEYFRLTQDAKMLRNQLNDEDRAARKLADGDVPDIDHGGDFAPLDNEQEIAARVNEALDVGAGLEIEVVAEQVFEVSATDESIIESFKAHAVEAKEEFEIAAVTESGDTDSSTSHLESKIDLEKVFATSPDASFVFRAPATEAVKARIGNRSQGNKSVSDENEEQGEDENS